MKSAIKIIPSVFFTLLLLVSSNFAQNDLLSRVPQLQDTSRKANSGELGCGPSDFSLVFTNQFTVSDLLVLLEARVKANQNNEVNPMSGEVSDLVYVILSGLPDFKDAAVIPVVKELLRDKNDVIRRWSVIALLKLAEKSEDLRKEIEQIKFPRNAVRSKKLPVWAKVEDNN